ncbi:MAG: MMPL family transporter [Trueperaceae bacterium]|nr:MMPL family transporter [Trueperaceae bacterium]
MFDALASLVRRYPRWILALWGLLFLIALPFASRVGEVLTAQPDSVPGSVAAEVRGLLDEAFERQNRFSVVMVTHTGAAPVGSEAFEERYTELRERLRDLSAVATIQDYRNTDTLSLSAPDGSFTVALLGLSATERSVAKADVAAIEAVLDEAGGAALRFSLAGGPATTRELEELGERDARRAELYGLPLSLTILAVAFGAVVAAGLPIIAALTTVNVTFALLFGLGQLLPFAVFTQSIVTMLGLATSIDYALLIVNRFREELRRGQAPRDAAATATLTAGRTVAFSGFTVVIALGALLIPPLLFIRSIGVGAMVVIFVGVSVALTVLPAALALLGHNVNRLQLSRREPGLRSRNFWLRRAGAVLRRPVVWAVGGTLLLVVLSAPITQMQVADLGARGLSADTDTRQVQASLEELELAGLSEPFDIVVDFQGVDGGFFNPASVRDISQLTRALGGLEPIGSVLSPTATDSVPRLFMFQYYARRDVALASDLAPLVERTVSRDSRYVLVQAYPQTTLTPRQVDALIADIRTVIGDLGVDARIGGSYVSGREWTSTLYRTFPLAIGLVYLATFVLLGLAFRSLLIPLKSVVLNTLTVAAAFGVVTLVFQYGVGASLIGLGSGIGYIDNSVPVFIFAIVFGLSMDYEVFLVARVFEAHERGLSDADAITEAMGATGGVITSAAAT